MQEETEPQLKKLLSEGIITILERATKFLLPLIYTYYTSLLFFRFSILPLPNP